MFIELTTDYGAKLLINKSSIQNIEVSKYANGEDSFWNTIIRYKSKEFNRVRETYAEIKKMLEA